LQIRHESLARDTIGGFSGDKVTTEIITEGIVGSVRCAEEAGPQERWWLVLERPDVELCLDDHGFEPDLFVPADVRAMTEVYLGQLRLTQAMEAGLVEVHGPRPLVRAFPKWLGVSTFAHYGRAAG